MPAQHLFKLNLLKQQVCHETPQSGVLILQCRELAKLFPCRREVLAFSRPFWP
jgi:hypothetical protein